jgi:hypothetical protein
MYLNTNRNHSQQKPLRRREVNKGYKSHPTKTLQLLCCKSCNELKRFTNGFLQVLDLHQNVPRRLTQYSTTYNRLSQDELTDLLALCILFSPDILNDKVFFEDTSTYGSANRFLELSSIKSSMLVMENVVIGGENRRVAKVMTCTRAWIRNNYEQPMRTVLSSQIGGGYQNSPTVRIGGPPSQPALQAPRYGTYNYGTPTRNNSGGCCCVIL